MALAAIDVQSLTKTYRGNVKALDGITFSVAAGTIYALLGPMAPGNHKMAGRHHAAESVSAARCACRRESKAPSTSPCYRCSTL